MGQAVAEQPAAPHADPIDAAVAAGSLPADGHADDLLSELAGAEIDRMLAAADVEPDVLPPQPTLQAAAPPAPVVTSAQPPAVPAEPAATVAPPVPTPEPAVAAADLDAVLAEASTERPVTPAPAEAEQLDLGAPVPQLPFFLRPFEWLSAPLDGLPDLVRDLIGKVAVVTLINSVAIITYVVVFRRHG